MVESNGDSTGFEEQAFDPEEMAETCLLLIQQLWSEKQINDEQRDALKGKSKTQSFMLSLHRYGV